MAVFFGGSNASRRPLNDEQIENLLGDGNVSEMEDLDLDEEIYPYSIISMLEGDEFEADQSVVEPFAVTPSELCSSSTSLTKASPEVAAAPSAPTSSNILPASPRPSVRTTKQNNTNRSLAKPTRTSKRSTTASTSTAKTGTSTNRGPSVPSRRSATSSNGTSKRRHYISQPQPWKQLPFLEKSHEFTSLPCREVRNPIEYFNEYMDDTFFEHMSNCSNMYHLRKTGNELKTSRAEVMKLFGILALMGSIPYPQLKMYWCKGIAMEKITSTMTRDRFSTLRNALHVVDSDTTPPGDVNPLWKVQPMIEQIRKGCYKQERVPGFYSIDEQMIPFTGRCILRQVVKNKPRPVGLKNFVLTTSQGLMLDFDIYKGAKTMFGNNMSLGLGPAVVLHLSRSVPPGSCLYHDRYFTTVPLIEELDKRNMHSTGTIMANRIPERSSLQFKEDKRMARGESQYLVRGPVAIVKWKDNKSVMLASNCAGSENNTTVKRWNKTTRQFVDVAAPQVVMNYNRHMGGVDVLDQQMEYYRTFIKTKKWTLKVILHFFDLAIVNAWRAYKIDCDANKLPKKKILDLLEFRMEIHEVLVNVPDKRRSEVLLADFASDDESLVTRKYHKASRPSNYLRYDGYDHLPEFDDIKSPRACQFESCCSRAKTRCIKCKVYLCISRGQNCFRAYHKK